MFFLTGLWHGANWTFIVWGLYHGFFLLLEEFIPVIKKLPKLIRRIYTLLAVTIGFVLFRADTIGEAVTFVSRMFSGTNMNAQSMAFALQALTPYFIVMLLAGILCCGPFSGLTQRVRDLESKQTLTARENLLQKATFFVAFFLLAWCMVRLAGGSYNPFIYFRF